MDFHYRIPAWEAVLNVVSLLIVIGMAVVTYADADAGRLDFVLLFLPVLVFALHLLVEVLRVGGLLRVTGRGIELLQQPWRLLEWRIPAEDIEWIGVGPAWPARMLVVRTRDGKQRQLRLDKWDSPRNVSGSRDWNKHPLVVVLRQHFDVREMTATETRRQNANIDLGKQAGWLTGVAVAFVVLGFVLLFLPQAFTLGAGIPWAPILATGAAGAAVAVYVLARSKAPLVTYPIIPLLVGGGFAFLATTTAHNVLYLSGTDVEVTYRLASTTEYGGQLWKDVAGQAPEIDITPRHAKPRKAGDTVTLHLREAAFDIYFCPRGELRKL